MYYCNNSTTIILHASKVLRCSMSRSEKLKPLDTTTLTIVHKVTAFIVRKQMIDLLIYIYYLYHSYFIIQLEQVEYIGHINIFRTAYSTLN